MAVTDLIDTAVFWSTDFDLLWRQEQSRQANGVTRVKDFGDPLWRATYTSRSLSPNELDYWRARLAALDNGVQQFYGRPTSRCYPIGYPNGTGLTAPGWFPAKTWDFTTGAEGWTAAGGTLSAAGGTISLVSANAASFILSPAFAIDGSKYRFVRLRLRRTAGTGTGYWHVMYSTPSHGFSNAYEKAIPIPADLSQWSTITLDMSQLEDGGDDWTTSTITGLRIYTVGLDQTVEFDWIAIGNDTFPGECFISAIGSDGNSFSLSGLPDGYNMSIGDYLQVRDNDLYQVVGTGSSVTVRPYVWAGTAVGDTVTLVKPSCVMTLVPGSINSTAELATGRGVVSFQAVESR